jgi:hypothetical protein
LQKGYNGPIIPYFAFKAIVMETFTEMKTEPMVVRPEALMVLRAATEVFLVGLFQEANCNKLCGFASIRGSSLSA